MKQQKNILMALLAYLGPLIIISYLVAPKDPFVKFHIKQSLTIILVSLITMVAGSILIFPFGPLFWLIRMSLGILTIIGIINALLGKEKELPIIGQIAESFDF